MTHLAKGRLLAAVAMTACAHAPPPAPAPAPPPVVWPLPPAAPRVRLVRLIPDDQAPADLRSGWRRFWDAVLGVDAPATADRLLERPFGVAARAGELLVADPDLPTVLRLAPGGGVEALRCPEREWGAPMAVAFDDRGTPLVADAGAGLVLRIEPDGRCTPLGAGELERPTGLAWSGGTVYVADPPRHQVVALAASGQATARLGGRGDGDGQFAFPSALGLGTGGTLLVVDALNFRVARLAGDGRWLGVFGSAGEEGGGFVRPKGVASDAAGRVYVSDAQRDLVLVFDAAGAYEYAIGAGGVEPGRFAHPAGLSIDGRWLYVADSLNRRIQVFEILGGMP